MNPMKNATKIKNPNKRNNLPAIVFFAICFIPHSMVFSLLQIRRLSLFFFQPLYHPYYTIINAQKQSKIYNSFLLGLSVIPPLFLSGK